MKNKWSAIWILLCVALCVNAGPGTVTEKGFIRDWLISGPYPSYQVNGEGTALDTDFLGWGSRGKALSRTQGKKHLPCGQGKTDRRNRFHQRVGIHGNQVV